MALEISEQTFSVSEDARLKLSNIRGHVVIHAGEAGQIQVKAALDPESGDAERTRVELRQEENGEVVAKTHYDEPFRGFPGRLQPCRVDYDVTVPANCKVHASTVSAGMALSGIHSELKLSTVSGGLELVDLSGELSASTVSGDLLARGLNGELKLHSVSGTVHLEGQTLDTIDATTVSGDIWIRTSLKAGPYNFQSVSGSIHWQVPEAAACTIEMHTLSGQAHVSLPGTRSESHGGTRTVRVQGGGTRIPFKSVSGDFYLVGPNAPAAVQADQQVDEHQAAEHPGHPDQHSILERIANGELTPEEGLQALRK
jgi:DUF4097 and DUF4098 domain-containing protein YvlB